MKTLLPLLFLSFAVTALADDAEKTKPTTVKTSAGTEFDIAVPAGWTIETLQPDPTLPSATSLTTPNKDVNLLISFISGKKGDYESKEKLESLLKINALPYVEGSVEKKTTIGKLETKSGTCLFAEFTDGDLVGKKTEPGQFKVVGTGLIASGDTLIVVTLLGDSFTGKSYLAGKDVIKTGITAHK